MLNIVVPMAGRGSRFADVGYKDPKPLIPMGNKVMIQAVINNLRPSRDHKFVFVCQRGHVEKYHLDERLKAWAPGCAIVQIEHVTQGAACTVLEAKEYIDADCPLMIANSDQWIDIDINDYLAKQDSDNVRGLIMTMKASDPKWSYVGFEAGRVVRVVEKEVVSDEATVGIYNFSKASDFLAAAEAMIAADERSNGEFYVAPVYTRLCKDMDYFVDVYNIGEDGRGMYGLGTPKDLEMFLNLDIARKALDF